MGELYLRPAGEQLARLLTQVEQRAGHHPLQARLRLHLLLLLLPLLLLLFLLLLLPLRGEGWAGEEVLSEGGVVVAVVFVLQGV